jgi:hypothetical protein
MWYWLEFTRDEVEWNRLHELQDKFPENYEEIQKLKDNIAERVLEEMSKRDDHNWCNDVWMNQIWI